MIIDYTSIIEGLKKEIKEADQKRKIKTDWVYIIDQSHKIWLVKPKYRIEVFQFAKAFKCTVQAHFVVDNKVYIYALNEKGDFKKIGEEDIK